MERVRISTLPKEVPCLLPSNKSKFNDVWIEIHKVLEENPVVSLIEEYFGNSLVPDETKWTVQSDLTALLRDAPTDNELLKRRGIVNLQCGIAMHAYCDGMAIVQSFIEKRTGNLKINTNAAKELMVDGYLVCIIATLIMEDNQRILEIFPIFLVHYFSLDSVVKEIKEPFLHMAVATYQQYESRVKDDYFLEALVQVYTMIKMMKSFLGTAFPTEAVFSDGTHMKDMAPPRIFRIQMHVYAMLQHDLYQRFDGVESMMRNDNMDSTSCQSKMRKQRPQNFERMFRFMTFSNVKFPLQYRGGPGGDRDPNNVLRILFEFRREALTNVRVTIDSEKGGFKLVTKRDIGLHEVFLMEAPFSCFGATSPSNPICENCLQSIPRKKGSGSSIVLGGCGCTRCGETYCSETCRDAAYEAYHKIMCVGSGWHDFLGCCALNNASSTFPSSICFSLKMLVTASLQGKSSLFEVPELKILANEMDASAPLETLTDRTVDSMTGSKILDVFRRFRELCPDLLPNLSAIDLAMAYATVAKNCIGTLEQTRLYVAASFANHSCDPNTNYQFNSNAKKLYFQALKPIKAGEEVLISYVCPGDYASRQSVLKMVYGFDCTCSLCMQECGGKKKKKGAGKKA